jgi:hypothetical protein
MISGLVSSATSTPPSSAVVTVIASQEKRGAGRYLRGIRDSLHQRICLGDLTEGRAHRHACRFTGIAS